MLCWASGGDHSAESITPTDDSAGESGLTINGEAPKAIAMDPIEASLSESCDEDPGGTCQGIAL